MPTAAACFLLPIGVVLYTMFGGIKATFLTDYGEWPAVRIFRLRSICRSSYRGDLDHSPHVRLHSLCNE